MTTTHITTIARDIQSSPNFTHAFKFFTKDGETLRAAPGGSLHNTDGKLQDFRWTDDVDGLELVEGSDSLESRLKCLGYYKIALHNDPEATAVSVCALYLQHNPETTPEEYEALVEGNSDYSDTLYEQLTAGSREAIDEAGRNNPLLAMLAEMAKQETPTIH